MLPVLTRRFWTYARFDRLLNRLLIGCGAFLFILAFIASEDGPSSSTDFRALDTSGFISLLQTPCPLIDQRVAYFEACKAVENEEGTTQIVCPEDVPQGVTYKPTTMELVTSTINALKSRKASSMCSYLQTSPIEVPDINELGWSESQKLMLEQLESAIEAVDKTNAQRKAMRDGTYEPPQFGPANEDETDDQN